MPTDHLHALSADAELLSRLASNLPAGPGEVVVHSVFDRVANVIDERGSMVTLAARSVDDAPDTVRLDLRSVADLGLQVGSRISCLGTHWILPDGRVLDLGETRPWDQVLPPLPVSAGALAWLRSFVATEGVAGGIRPPSAAAGSWERATSATLDRQLTGVLDAIRRNDSASVRLHTGRMVGLGGGLTPAGDDALQGLLLVAGMSGSRLRHALPVLVEVVESHQGHTTPLSHVGLVHAAAGRTRAVVVQLLERMAAAADIAALTLHGRRVIAIGHTSGTDLLSGLCAALDLDHELRGDR